MASGSLTRGAVEHRTVSESAPTADVARLTAQIARGESRAVEEFYRAWFDRCYAMARSITRRDESFCLDLVQEAMLRVVRSMRPMQTQDDLERWMTRVVHTAALDRLRGERRRAAREAAVTHRQRADSPAPSAELGERIAWVRERLREMEWRDRMLLWARVGLHRTLDEAGAGAGVTGDAAHGRVRRALLRLRSAAKEVFRD